MPPSRPRLEWIDLFRGLAVVGMVWTHAGNTFLEASIQKAATWQSMTYYHGLVAPAFFWILGYVRGMAFRQVGRWLPQAPPHDGGDHSSSSSDVRQSSGPPRLLEDQQPCLQTPKPAWPSVKRLLMIGGIGYAMHLPYGFASGGDFSEATQWAMFLVDVLQCLAVSGLLLVLLERVPKATLVLAAAALAFFVVFATAAQTWRTGFIPLDAYFTSAHGSLFPLFPWAGFAIAGFLAGQVRVTALLMVIASLLLAFGIRRVPGLDWSIGFFLERLGWVMLLAAFTSGVLERLCQKARSLTGWLFLAGRESLVVYVVHLLFIHALPSPSWSPDQRIGPTQPPWVVAAIFAVLLTLSVGAAWLNERRKRA